MKKRVKHFTANESSLSLSHWSESFTSIISRALKLVQMSKWTCARRWVKNESNFSQQLLHPCSIPALTNPVFLTEDFSLCPNRESALSYLIDSMFPSASPHRLLSKKKWILSLVITRRLCCLHCKRRQLHPHQPRTQTTQLRTTNQCCTNAS